MFKGLLVDHLALEDGDENYLNDSPDFAELELEAGEVVAVCGPSGSGKSALLHVLAGSNICKKEGHICYGKIKVKFSEPSFEAPRCPQCWHKHVRLVPHQDLFVSSLTCSDTIETYTRLNDNVQDTADLEKFDHMLINTLETKTTIAAKAKLKKISVISALTANPAFLLIDEPLFLLEHKAIREIGSLLENFAVNEEAHDASWNCKQCGLESTIIKRVVILALNSTCLAIEGDGYLEFVKKFLLLSSSKQIIFYGSLEDALRSLGLDSKPALAKFLEESQRDMSHLATENKQIHTKSKGKSLGSKSVLGTLFVRHYRQIRNVPKQYLRVILERILIFTLLAFIFEQPNSRSALIGLYFFLPINQTSNVILFTSSESFAPSELTIIERDRFHQLYHSWSIVLVKYVVMSIVNIIPALAYLPVIFYVSAITNHSSFPLFILANILNIICSCAVGLFIASCSKDQFVRNLWLFGISTIFATFGGIHTAANYHLPWTIRWIQYLSPTYYLFLITIRLEFTNQEIENVLAIGKFLLDTGEAFGALAGLTVAYLLCAFAALHLTTSPRRMLF